VTGGLAAMTGGTSLAASGLARASASGLYSAMAGSV